MYKHIDIMINKRLMNKLNKMKCGLSNNIPSDFERYLHLRQTCFDYRHCKRDVFSLSFELGCEGLSHASYKEDAIYRLLSLL